MKIMNKAFATVATLTVCISSVSLASRSGHQQNSQPSPSQSSDFSQCNSKGKPLPIDDAQVLNWEDTTANQFASRAHIEGKIHAVYSDHSGHKHFGVQIGQAAHDAIEVIYNESFGALPALSVGDDVEACGDYITSTAPAGRYPASPDRAILHWVHKSNAGSHASGFVKVNGVLFGGGNGSGN